MNKLKGFFEKKKLDNKFKQAGTGHSLSGPKPSSSAPQPARQNSSQHRQEQSSGPSRAGRSCFSKVSSIPDL